MTRTTVIVEITHDKPIPALADKIAGRAWTLDGVRYATAHVDEKTVAELEQAGFSMAEIALGSQEVVR
jgi:hypothetical protein